MKVDPGEAKPYDVYQLLVSSVVPRPIALVSTVSADGVRNLAPFSFFNAVSVVPPILSLAIQPSRSGAKDTAVNLEATGELVVNFVTEAMTESMNQTAGEWPPDLDEFEQSGLTPVPSERIRPWRVGESPVQFECRVHQVIEVGDAPTSLVLAEVVLAHVEDGVVRSGLPASDLLRPVARMGGDEYSELGRVWDLARPKVD